MNVKRPLRVLVSASVWLVITSQASAHCDTLDGPVVKDAQAALAARDVTGVLKWIEPQREQEIKNLFRQVLTVRSQGQPAKALAEKYFFESLVRIHRAGEGAPYTGLKPAGQVEPIVAASDEALYQKNVDELVNEITQHVDHEIRQRFQTALQNKEHVDHSVEAGRSYVRSYVEFTHYMEGLHQAVAGMAHGHGPSSFETPSHNTQEVPMNTKLTENMAIRDIVVQFPQTRTLLETLGIDYCCGGKATLSKAVEQAGLSTDRVLADLAQALERTGQDTASVHDWSSTSSTELANHIEQTHHVFMKKQLPRLANLLNKTVQAHGEQHGAMFKRLKQSYTSFKTDIEMHLGKEEQILFPLIRQMETFQQDHGSAPDMHSGSIGNPISQMEHEHDVAGQFLTQMRQITGNYTLPDDACPTFRALFEGLDALEKDLHEHIHLENNILFPKAQNLEKEID